MTSERIYNEPGLYDEVLPRYMFAGQLDDELLAQTLTTLTNGRVARRALELGCGTGRMTGVIEPFAEALTGVDNSEAMLQVLRQRHPSVRAIRADARSFLAERNDAFDLVVACWSLNYPLLSCFERNTGIEIHRLPLHDGLAAASAFLTDLTDRLAPGGSLLTFWFDPESAEQQFVTETWETIAPFPGSGRAFTKELLVDHLDGQPGETRCDHHDGVMVAPTFEQAFRWFMDGHFKSFPRLAANPVRRLVQQFLNSHTEPDSSVRVPAGLDVISYRLPG